MLSPSRGAVLIVLAIAVGLSVAVHLGRTKPPVELLVLPSDANDVVVEELATAKYVDPSPDKGFCGSDVYLTYAGESVAHGLTVDTELPRELVEAVEELGWPIEEYEHRWFGKQRIVLFSASPNDETKPLFVDVMEIVLIEDESGEHTWSIPYRKLGRPCG